MGDLLMLGRIICRIEGFDPPEETTMHVEWEQLAELDCMITSNIIEGLRVRCWDCVRMSYKPLQNKFNIQHSNMFADWVIVQGKRYIDSNWSQSQNVLCLGLQYRIQIATMLWPTPLDVWYTHVYVHSPCIINTVSTIMVWISHTCQFHACTLLQLSCLAGLSKIMCWVVTTQVV